MRAEFFAKSGVKIADKIGVVDYLSFGSECGNIDELIAIAKNMLDKTYLDTVLASSDMKDVGYPELCETIYRKLFNSKISNDFFSPNNILALEYIKAILSTDTKLQPHTISRFGAAYSEEKISNSSHQSATAIRSLLRKNFISALNFVPKNSIDVLVGEYEKKRLPTDPEKLSSAIISHFRLNSPDANKHVHDAKGGLYNRLYNASFKVNTISSLTNLAGTKKYTTARIRRAIWYSFFGVTSSTVKELPCYTQVLAMDNVGKTILKDVKKISDFPILTKPSDYIKLPAEAKRQCELAIKADTVFHLTKPTPPDGTASLITTPYVMK